MNTKIPLISCVCVTRKKPELLKRAIGCFLSQSYPNKELIVLFEDDDVATESFLGTGPDREGAIRVFRVPAYPKLVLGELRNFAIRVAAGEFICQWDDDDWYHVNRLTEQYRKLLIGFDGSIMTQWLVFDSVDAKAYVSNIRLWEGSVLCRKEVLLLKPYENKALGEDTSTIDYLMSLEKLCLLDGRPELYIYNYHGRNSWNYDHWNQIFKCSTLLPEEVSGCISDILAGKVSVTEGSMLLDKALAGNMNRINCT